MMLAVATMIVAQAAAPVSTTDGLALFQQVCVDGARLDPQRAGIPISFAALPPAAHATLARLNNAYERLDAEGGVHRAAALPGGTVFLITPSGAKGDGPTAPSCIVLWHGGDFSAARAYHPPYAAHVALQSVENDGWFLLRAIPSDPVAAPSP